MYIAWPDSNLKFLGNPDSFTREKRKDCKKNRGPTLSSNGLSVSALAPRYHKLLVYHPTQFVAPRLETAMPSRGRGGTAGTGGGYSLSGSMARTQLGGKQRSRRKGEGRGGKPDCQRLPRDWYNADAGSGDDSRENVSNLLNLTDWDTPGRSLSSDTEAEAPGLGQKSNLPHVFKFHGDPARPLYQARPLLESSSRYLC